MAVVPSGCASAFSRPSICGGTYFSNLASFTGYIVGSGKVFQASLLLGISSIAAGDIVSVDPRLIVEIRFARGGGLGESSAEHSAA